MRTTHFSFLFVQLPHKLAQSKFEVIYNQPVILHSLDLFSVLIWNLTSCDSGPLMFAKYCNSVSRFRSAVIHSSFQFSPLSIFPGSVAAIYNWSLPVLLSPTWSSFSSLSSALLLSTRPSQRTLIVALAPHCAKTLHRATAMLRDVRSCPEIATSLEEVLHRQAFALATAACLWAGISAIWLEMRWSLRSMSWEAEIARNVGSRRTMMVANSRRIMLLGVHRNRLWHLVDRALVES